MRTPLTTAETAQIAGMLRAKKTAKQIGAVLGRSKNSIISMVQRTPSLASIGFGHARLPRPRNHAAGALRDQVVAFVKKNPGATARQVATALDCSTAYVRATAKRERIDLGKVFGSVTPIAIEETRKGRVSTNPLGMNGVKVFGDRFSGKTFDPGVMFNAPAPLNVKTIDRGAKQCAWPVSGSGEHMLMCGHDTGDILNSYCPNHRAQAYQPRQSMKVAA